MKLASSVCLASLALCLPAKADIIDITVTGYVRDGFDYAGMFVTPNTTLTNQHFTYTFGFDSSLGHLINFSNGGQALQGGTAFSPYASPVTNVVLTINNVSIALPTSYYGDLETAPSLFYVQVVSPQADGGDIFRAYLSNPSIPHFPTSFAAWDLLGTYTPIGDGQFSTFNLLSSLNIMQAIGNLTVEQITFDIASTVSVPGPIVGAGFPGLAAMGLFVFNWYRRRRNNGGLPA